MLALAIVFMVQKLSYWNASISPLLLRLAAPKVLGFALIFSVAMTAVGQPPSAPAPQSGVLSAPNQAFELINRTSYETQQSQGVRISAGSVSGFEWRVVAAQTSVDFERVLKETEAQVSFDLVFPLAASPSGHPTHPAPPYPGFLCDQFRPLALPAPGLEFQIGYDGIWNVAFRPSATGREGVALVSSGAESLEVPLWNGLPSESSISAAAAWTPDFAPIRGFPLPENQGGAWIALEWVQQKPWSDEAVQSLGLPIQKWQKRLAKISRVSQSPFSIDQSTADLLLHIPDSDLDFAQSLQSGRSVTIGFAETIDADRCPAIIGGALPIIRQGEYVGPQKLGASDPTDLKIRKDLAPCFEPNGSAFSWIGVSHTTNEVWLGCSGATGARNGVMPPSVLAEKLKGYGLDYAGICAAGTGGLAIRWQDRWLGASNNAAPGNITAALCLRMQPVPDKPHWVNCLRDTSVGIEMRNAAGNAGSLDALRDGRMAPGAMLDSFLWASPKDSGEPVTLDFDLRESRSIYWIEMLLAEKAGFSSHFNLRDYTWQFRDSSSSGWTDAAKMTANEQALTRHVFPQPIRARWWRLLIPPQSDAENGNIVHRLAELEFWSLQQ